MAGCGVGLVGCEIVGHGGWVVGWDCKDVKMGV